jgi:hypothetical protein
MPGPNRTHERLLALFVLGLLLFTPPLLTIFNSATRILGVPLLPLYLFVAWAAVIALVALAVEPSDSLDDRATSGITDAGEQTSVDEN